VKIFSTHPHQSSAQLLPSREKHHICLSLSLEGRGCRRRVRVIEICSKMNI